jgi:hypothetical protein
MVLIVFFPFALTCVMWKSRIGSWRDAFLASAVIWGTLAVAITELLSLFNAITPSGLFVAWSLAAVAVYLLGRHVPRMEADAAPPGNADRLPKCVAAFLATLAAALALMAWIGPPNNTDSMTNTCPVSSIGCRIATSISTLSSTIPHRSIPSSSSNANKSGNSPCRRRRNTSF